MLDDESVEARDRTAATRLNNTKAKNHTTTTSTPMDTENEEASFDKMDHVLNTVDGEISFFRSLMRARPLGMHRHFHIMAMQIAIEKALKQPVAVDELWKKLDTCYNMEQLDFIVSSSSYLSVPTVEPLQESEYEAALMSSPSSTPQPVSSPSPEQDLSDHPFFRQEFQLPADHYIENLIIQRRIRQTPSPTSSPEPVQQEPQKPVRNRKRKASKAEFAGLVSGDSDSSALTQESGDDVEDAAGTPTDRRAASVGTAATEAGTEDTHEDEDGMDTGEFLLVIFHDSLMPNVKTEPLSANRGRGSHRKRGRGRGGGPGRGKRKKKL